MTFQNAVFSCALGRQWNFKMVPCWPSFRTLCRPPFWLDLSKIIFIVISASLIVAHDCGYPLSRYTCRATRVAADFLDFIAFCRCSTGVALHPLKILVSHLPHPPVPGGAAPKFGSEKVSRYTGVSQLQLRVSRYTVQLSPKSDSKMTFGLPIKATQEWLNMWLSSRKKIAFRVTLSHFYWKA